jgi:hypothetical protein
MQKLHRLWLGPSLTERVVGDDGIEPPTLCL